jgi:hypothetical protein
METPTTFEQNHEAKEMEAVKKEQVV